MLYGTSLGAVELNLRGVRFVVLDEVHYMNDQQRGTVWEESIIYCPPLVQLVALSATVANAAEMAEWMNAVHGDTTLISTDHRPVPLRFHYYDGRHLTPLLRRAAPADARPRHDAATGRRLRRWEHTPDPDQLAAELAAREMLPAIYFVFSRRGCDQAMESCGHLQLLSEEEIDRVEAFLEGYLREYPSTAGHPHLPYLFRGVAAHHAGLLPTWKVLVERLFQQGLVKVVFATETLAAGINMPARTTVLSSITKRGDNGHRPLTASEFLQMSGRAGRRGMDRQGHVVVVASPFQTVAEAQRLATAPPDPLGSHFTPTYGMVLNLLQRHSLADAEYLVTRSFGQFLEERRQARRSARVRSARQERARRDAAAGTPAPSGIWARFLRLKDVLHEYRYLEGDRPTRRGIIAAALRAEHELLIAEALFSGILDTLSPSCLAAVGTALVSEELRRSAWVKVLATGAAARAIQEVVRLAREVRAVQNRHRVDLPTRVYPEAAGLTQLWAEDADWDYLMTLTNLDEGDVVRLLRRTLDLLEQIAHAPLLEECVRSLARDAALALNREPVREIL
jgi:superfamily II RNA helicase